MTDRSLDQWLQFLECLHPSEMDLGLERVASVAGRLNLLETSCPVVTVAGTNGKGSTVAALEAVLLRSGKSVGAFTSPHLLRFNERIRVGGECASDREIVAAFTAIEGARGKVSLTYFEFATLAALYVFRKRAAEVIVLEVGLGGRLDATNIIDPTIAVVTSIALDHQHWLGTTRDQIALEKAGIVRAARPLIIADPEPPAALLDRAVQIGAVPVWRYGRDFGLAGEKNGEHIELQDPHGNSVRVPAPARLDLLPQNVCSALQAACLLGELPDPVACCDTLSKLVVTGRRQTFQVDGLDHILDVAHNPASARALGDYLDSIPATGRTLAVFSAMADKDIPGIVAPLAGRVDAWFIADQIDNPRAMAADDIAATLRSIGENMISVSKNLRQALRRARQLMTGDDRLVVFGSFFTVAAVLPMLERDRQASLAGATT